MQVAGAGAPLGGEAFVPLVERLGGRGLIRSAAGFSLLAPLAIKGFQGVTKVLIEFSSNFIVAQELPAGGRGGLLPPVSGGLLQWGVGVLREGLPP